MKKKVRMWSIPVMWGGILAMDPRDRGGIPFNFPECQQIFTQLKTFNVINWFQILKWNPICNPISRTK